jgi:hypothetical protein
VTATRLYAEGTTVTPERSQAEIQANLRRYGATGFMFGWEGERAVVAFVAHGRQVRFELPLPDADDPTWAVSAGGRKRDATKAYEAEVMRRWRALAFAIKAKLEAVETGITSFEDEFLAHLVLPGGQTVGDHVRPAVAAAYTTGVVRPLLAIEGSS